MSTVASTVLHFTLRSDGIIFADSQAGVEPTSALLQEAEEACHQVRGDVRRPALWNIQQLTRPKPEAWLGFIQNAPKNLTAVAVVGDTEQVRLLGAFPSLINDLLLPLRMFDDEAEAVEWLRRYV